MTDTTSVSLASAALRVPPVDLLLTGPPAEDGSPSSSEVRRTDVFGAADAIDAFPAATRAVLSIAGTPAQIRVVLDRLGVSGE